MRNMWCYSRYWYLTHPWLFARDLWTNIKFAYQRAVRGWDDSYIWSMDSALCDILVPMLKELRECKMGVPGYMDVKGKTFDERKEAYNKDLDEIIAGFEAGARLIDGMSPIDDEFYDRWRKEYPEEENMSMWKDSEEHPDWVEYVGTPGYNKLWEEMKVQEKSQIWLKEQEKIFHRGMILFHRHFFSLWT